MGMLLYLPGFVFHLIDLYVLRSEAFSAQVIRHHPRELLLLLWLTTKASLSVEADAGRVILSSVSWNNLMYVSKISALNFEIVAVSRPYIRFFSCS